jgi:hypothetical protein
MTLKTWHMKLITAVMTLASIAGGIALARATDFKTPIRNLDGTTIPISTTDPTPITLGKICEDALLANNLPGDTMAADDKRARFWLALKIHEGKEPLSIDDISLIKKVVALAYGPLVVGRVSELLDPVSRPK